MTGSQLGVLQSWLRFPKLRLVENLTPASYIVLGAGDDTKSDKCQDHSFVLECAMQI